MKRLSTALMFCVLIAGCGSSNYSAPRNLDNACSILDQRPSYLRAMRKTQGKWGVPISVQMAVIYQESKFIANARTPYRFALGVIPLGRQSSAYGYSQALDGTWDEYRSDQRRWAARRDRIGAATDFIGWYMVKSRNRLGISLNDARNQYLAYHEGRTGYARGSYNRKPWLLRVSREVGNRAVTYDGQLRACGKA
jgi:hypothetical protein